MYLVGIVWNVKTLWIMPVCLFTEYHLPFSFFGCVCYVEWVLDVIWNVVSGWGLILRLISKCLCMIPLCSRSPYPPHLSTIHIHTHMITERTKSISKSIAQNRTECVNWKMRLCASNEVCEVVTDLLYVLRKSKSCYVNVFFTCRQCFRKCMVQSSSWTN